METLLRFPAGKHREIVRHVRRDPQFAPQLYFVSAEEENGGRHKVSLEQAIWDTENNQITSFEFLTSSNVPSHIPMHFAVDEKGQCIYIVCDSDREMAVDTDRFPLTYGKPDKLGYRRISVPVDQRHSNKFIFHHNAQKVDLYVAAIDVCPSTAELILHCEYVVNDKNPWMFFLPRRHNLYQVETTMLNPLQSHEMEARSYVFSKFNDLLTLISYDSCNAPVDAEDDNNRNAIRADSPDGFMILYSHDTQMQRINTLQIDPVQLLHCFLPKTLLEGLKTSSSAGGRMPDFMFFGSHLQLLGHVNKYVLFFFHHNYVLAAKWPKDWYKLEQVPEVQQSKVLCVNKQKKHGQICDVWLLSPDLFFKVEKSGAEAIRRMSLGHEFKDYRTCAFCGKEEKGKSKNKHGKRISSFKVCRLCKELNLHKRYTDAKECHYCSFECVQKDWKQHKKVHSGNGKQKNAQ